MRIGEVTGRLGAAAIAGTAVLKCRPTYAGGTETAHWLEWQD